MNPSAENRHPAPLGDLYQEVILDHNRNPRNFREIPGCTASCHGHNPLCGDDYRIDLVIAPGADAVITDIGFTGKGCAISKASGSMMTAKVKGRTAREARQVSEAFLRLVTRDEPPAGEAGKDADLLGSLNIFAGVKKYPIRVKCATLVWRALDEALTRAGSTTSSGGAV